MRTIAFVFALSFVALAGTAQACGEMHTASTAKSTITAAAAPLQTPVVVAPKTGG